MLALDSKESSACVEEKIVRKKDDLTKDGEFILPSNKEDEKNKDEQPLIWKMKKLRDSKRKDKMIDFRV